MITKKKKTTTHNDLNTWFQGLQSNGRAGDETPAPDRDDTGVQVRYLLDDLQAHGALAGHNVWMVIAGRGGCVSWVV